MIQREQIFLRSGSVNWCWARQHSHFCFGIPRGTHGHILLSRDTGSCTDLINITQTLTRFVVLSAVTMEITILWDMTPCSLVE
jgi:hypothetical protein